MNKFGDKYFRIYDNDLEQARTALITSVSFFKMLSKEAEQLKLSSFDLLEKINNEF